ncbi:PEGA domain-containing protein [Oceanispirochaeta crateris]|uniref:PEGA domain-containing protein n=1 Tax=Oceanispirochaeta crateris TaxID=2518645 RepID=A0A5C1QLR5_9SPIO|nr:PEGA domain-containing protein [Oceanispirochaeta crateris]QEN07494.1 PEGA domain-containing protein [Oceanispirochaeta crateris]
MKKTVNFLLLMLFLPTILFSQSKAQPVVQIQMRKILEYERPARLIEEDKKNSESFQFVSGLEIVTDVEYMRVFLFDDEVGRTPYENNRVQNGSLRIKLKKTGYEDLTLWVTVRENYRTTVTVSYIQSAESESLSVRNGNDDRSKQLFKIINPEDPGYYRQLYYMNPFDFLNHKLAVMAYEDSKEIMILNPDLSVAEGAQFSWDGLDGKDQPVLDGEYLLKLTSDDERNSFSVGIDREYSRRSSNYFSGFTGLALVPFARTLFQGDFQFGSTISLDKEEIGDSLYNLPFSFFIRTSPLKRWEAAFEAETAFVTEDNQPYLTLNSSQKVYIYGSYPFQVSLGMRGTYRSRINNLSDSVSSSFIKNPSGGSFYIPFQYRKQNWDFFVSPEIMFTLKSISDDVSQNENDILTVLRWGISYTPDLLFSVGISSALYLPSINGSKPVMQAGLEGTYYIKNTPMYLNIYSIMQKVNEGDRGRSMGLNLGFLL